MCIDTEAKQEQDDGEPSVSYFGMSDAEFAALLATQLQQHALAAAYPVLFAAAPGCMVQWRQRYRGDAALWKRLFHKDRVLKEFIEAVPVLDAVIRFVDAHDMQESSTGVPHKFTIIDLCSGKGFLSMFLSELLPPSKVERFVLMDKAWPMHNGTTTTTTLQPHHMSWQHIYGTAPSSSEDGTTKKYIETWPIPLTTSRQDLKHGNQRRKLAQRFLQNESSPVILLGIHLCGTLSLRAIDLFNDHAAVKFFCLKPCCLPGMVHAKRHEMFAVGAHQFDSKLVCVHGKWNKDIWKGPHRSQLAHKFAVWAQNLYWGIGNAPSHEDSLEEDKELQKKQVRVRVQTEGGYQNEFLFAERYPATESVWEALTANSTRRGNDVIAASSSPSVAAVSTDP